MTHLETELKKIQSDTEAMWQLVISQLEKTYVAFTGFDKGLCREVIAREKRVNSMELALDRSCEHLFALHTPVAIDLRFVLATLKINNNLERLGDIAEGICKFLLHEEKPYDQELISCTQLDVMFVKALAIVEDALLAFQDEDTKLARSIFQKDEDLNKINAQVKQSVITYISAHPENIGQALDILSIIRRLERVGDQSKNTAEEIIFYLEAKVLRHKENKKNRNPKK